MPFVADVDGAAVGAASLFEFDSFARHAEAGISLLPHARGRGTGTAVIAQLMGFGFARRSWSLLAVSGGGRIVAEPDRQPWGYTAVVADPDGHLWQLVTDSQL